MFTRFFSPVAGTSAMLQQWQQSLAQMRQRYDEIYNLLLEPASITETRTPSDVVYSDRRITLVRYRPLVERPRSVPVLIIPSPLNTNVMFDLAPNNSMVQYLLKQGLDVYMLAWHSPGIDDRFVTLDQYVTGYLRRTVQRVRSVSGQDQISLIGYSMGGVLTTMYTALYGRHVKNLVTLATPINFHDGGIMSQWTQADRFNVDIVVDTLGTMPAALMQASFRMLAPTAQIMQQIALAEKYNDIERVRDLIAMQAWIENTTAFIGEAYRKYIKECYQDNLLIQNRVVIDRRRVDLGQINANLLAVTASKDYFCPPESAAVLNDLVGSSDKQVLELPCGHIGIIVGRTAAEQFWPQLADWLIARSRGRQAAQPVAETPTSETAVMIDTDPAESLAADEVALVEGETVPVGESFAAPPADDLPIVEATAGEPPTVVDEPFFDEQPAEVALTEGETVPVDESFAAPPADDLPIVEATAGEPPTVVDEPFFDEQPAEVVLAEGETVPVDESFAAPPAADTTAEQAAIAELFSDEQPAEVALTEGEPPAIEATVLKKPRTRKPAQATNGEPPARRKKPQTKQ